MHASIDHRIAAIAHGRHGLITRKQMLALGMSPRAIEHRVACGRLHRIHRGVYAVGHRVLDWIARAHAAVLAIGGDAVVDLRQAARFYESERPSWRHGSRPIPILTTRQVRISDPGISVTRTRTLPDEDRVVIDGVPVVSASRLVVNLSLRESTTVVCKLLDELAYHDLLDIDGIRACAQRLRTRNGPAYERLEDAIGRYQDGERGTDSELEELARQWTESLNVPRPAYNCYVRTGTERPRLDQVYRDLMIAVEVDHVGHLRPTRRRRDQRRRASLRRDGWIVIVMTRERLTDPIQRQQWGRTLENAVHRRLAERPALASADALQYATP